MTGQTPLPLTAVLAVSILVGGCATTNTDRPQRQAELPLPERFSVTAGDPLADEWWRHFNDPRLDRLIDTALDGSFSLAAARNRLREARATARIDGASLLPTLDGTGEASATREEGDTSERYSAGFAAGYEVDLWGRIESTAEASRIEADATAADLRAAGITLTADTASTFYSLLRQRAIIDLLQSQRRTNRQIADLIATRYRNGQAALDELLRQRRLVESAGSELATARTELADLRNSLAALTGQSPSGLSLPEGHARVEPPPLPAIGIPANWLNRRPDLRAAWLRVRSADESLAAAIAAQYPRLDLTATVETTGSQPSELFDDWVASLAAGLTVPLFRGDELEAGVERSRAARAVAFNEYAQTSIDAVAEVETALATTRNDRQRLESLNRQVALAEQALEQLRARYLNGAGTYLDVLNALTTLQDVRRQRLESRWALLLDRVTLIRTIAGGWSGPATTTSETTDDG